MNDKGITTADIATADEARAEEQRDAEERDKTGRLPENRSHQGGASDDDRSLTPLFPGDRVKALRDRWHALQVGFVDEPRKTVEQADQLVAEVMRELAQGFADERTNLEHQWEKGERISTEELRLTLRRYRSFFERLLSV